MTLLNEATSSPLWESRVLDLAGFGVQVLTEDARQRTAVEADTRTYATFDGPPSLLISWRNTPLDFRGQQFVGEDGHLQIASSPQVLAARHGVLGAIATEHRVDLGGIGNDPEALLDDFQSVFGATFTYWLAQRGRFAIHGAAIGCHGRALLVLGRPGAGKSSAAWGAHQAGMELLGDDTLFVRKAADRYEVCGMRKVVALPGEILDHIPDDASQTPLNGGGSRDRWALQPEMQRTDWHPVVGVISAAHGEDPDGALVPAEGIALIRTMIGAYYSATDETQLRAWFPHAAALARLPAWELHHTPLVDRRLAVAARLIEQAFDRVGAATPASDG